jgi:hypothetical protein
MNSRACWLVAGLMVFAVGCGGASGPKVYPAGGRVTYQGMPVSGATVTFAPADGVLVSYGVTDAEGKFTLKGARGQDGAPLGTQYVTVIKVASSGGPPASDVTAAPGSVPLAVDPSNPGGTVGGAAIGPGAEAPTEAVVGSEVPEKYASVATSGLQFTITEDPAKNNFEITLE